MEQLWAPWRMAYISNEKPEPIPPGEADSPAHCFICKALASTADRENLVAHRTEVASVILNRFPYNSGHLLIVPNRHVGNYTELSSQEMLLLQTVVSNMMNMLNAMMKPDGYNVGLNLGRAAGAGVPGHLHWHVVPRWFGDNNFMPVVGDVKVMVQSLDACWQLLREELAKS